MSSFRLAVPVGIIPGVCRRGKLVTGGPVCLPSRGTAFGVWPFFKIERGKNYVFYKARNLRQL